jgi:hypothetical protein
LNREKSDSGNGYVTTNVGQRKWFNIKSARALLVLLDATNIIPTIDIMLQHLEVSGFMVLYTGIGNMILLGLHHVELVTIYVNGNTP